jgi:hypothetical protein
VRAVAVWWTGTHEKQFDIHIFRLSQSSVWANQSESSTLVHLSPLGGYDRSEALCPLQAPTEAQPITTIGLQPQSGDHCIAAAPSRHLFWMFEDLLDLITESLPYLAKPTLLLD